MEIARHGLNDHRLIRLREASGALCEPFDGPTVVCTHHAPHRRSVAAQFDGDLLSAAFVSHLPELIEGPNAPDLWVHGHTHAALDYRVGKCRVVCNPLGYRVHLHKGT